MVDDNPQDLVHDLAAEAVFGAHPLGRPVIGTADVISRVSPRALRSWHGGAYVGSNVVLSAAGNVRHDPLVEHFAKLRRPAPVSVTRPSAAARPRSRSRATASCAAAPSSTTSCSRRRGSPRDDERRYAVSLLDAILGGSASSRLFQEIREKRGMAYSVYTYGSQYAETGQVGIYVGTREDNLRECLDVTAAELQDVAAGNLRAGELDRAKENLEGRLLLSFESTSNRMTRLGRALDLGDRARHRARDDPRGSGRSPRRTSRRPPATSSPPSASPPRGSGLARAASGRPSPDSTRRSPIGREGLPLRGVGQGRRRARPCARSRGSRGRRGSRVTARPDATSPSTSRVRTPCSRTSRSASRRASRR